MCNAKLCGGNTKTGADILTFSKLYGAAPVYIDRLKTSIVGTCGHHCAGCDKSCYVRKSYRYDSVKYRHALNTIAMRENVAETFATLSAQVSRKKKPVRAIRGDQSGELETYDEFCGYIGLSNEHPEKPVYIYTKCYEYLFRYFATGAELPANFTVNISVWGPYGLEEYKALRGHRGVKAFVYCDKTYTPQWYRERGLIIETMCPAYNERGEMNKAATCGKCGLCIDGKARVIGCWDHK